MASRSKIIPLINREKGEIPYRQMIYFLIHYLNPSK